MRESSRHDQADIDFINKKILSGVDSEWTSKSANINLWRSKKQFLIFRYADRKCLRVQKYIEILKDEGGI